MESFNKENYHNFSTDEEARTWGNKHYKKWAYELKEKTLSLDYNFKTLAKGLIERYCGWEFRQINAFLRGTIENHLDWNASKHTYESMGELLAVLIMFAPHLPEDIVIYRAIPDFIIDDLYSAIDENGGWVKDRGFLSTSLLIKSIIERKEPILRIYLRKGIPGIYTSCIAGRSEYEILLLPNSNIRFINDNPEHYTIDGHMVYDCELSYFPGFKKFI